MIEMLIEHANRNERETAEKFARAGYDDLNEASIATFPRRRKTRDAD